MTAAPVVGGKSMDDLLDETHSSSDNERSNFDNLLELEDKTVPQPSSSSAGVMHIPNFPLEIGQWEIGNSPDSLSPSGN